MKITTKAASQKRLANLNENKTSVAYTIVAELIGIEGKKSYKITGNIIRPVYTSGSGRFCSNQDHTAETTKLLTKLGIDFKTGNDSPRGGLTGNFIEILTKIK